MAKARDSVSHVLFTKRTTQPGPLTVIVLEVHLLDNLAHAQNVRGGAEHVHAHPRVTGVQGGDSIGSLGSVTDALDGGLDIGPSSNDGTEDHQTEGEQSHGGDAAAEPEDLTVGDDNDGQVLEDGVHGNGEELERLGAGIDHAHEQQRDREPCCSPMSASRSKLLQS